MVTQYLLGDIIVSNFFKKHTTSGTKSLNKHIDLIFS